MENEKIVIVKKIDLKGTLDLLNVGESISLKSKQAKTNTIRTTVGRFAKEGKLFAVTEAGQVNKTLVTRTK
jgi:hypothetical protein